MFLLFIKVVMLLLANKVTTHGMKNKNKKKKNKFYKVHPRWRPQIE